MVADLPRAKLSELAAREGAAAIGDNAERCLKLLIEECGEGFHEDCAALTAAVERGIVRDLRNGPSKTLPWASFLDGLSKRLRDAAGLQLFMAQWSVQSWALALGVAPESEKLKIAGLDAVAASLERTPVPAEIDPETFERIVSEAVTAHHIRESDARLYFLRRAALNNKHNAAAKSPAEDAAPGAVAPAAEPPNGERVGPIAVEPPSGQTAARPIGERRPDALPRSRHKTAPMWRASWVLHSIAVLAVLGLIAVFAVRQIRNETAETSNREQQAYAAAQGNPDRLRSYIASCRVCAAKPAAIAEIDKLESSDRERQAYEAARGNRGRLQGYLDTCRTCAFKQAALEELARFRMAEEDTRLYGAARGDPDALQHYIDTCGLCTFRRAAIDEKSRLLNDGEERLYGTARGNPDALKKYLETCRVCAFRVPAEDEMFRLLAVREEERTYKAAQGSPEALQRYIDNCRACAFKPDALEELSRFRLAEDERGYRAARGNPGALRAYANTCKECTYKRTALDEIARLEASPSPRGAAKPDLEGLVTAITSSALIRVGATRWVQLYGIKDALGNPIHKQAMRGYLEESQGSVACFARASGRFQCFASGKDLALMALRDGLAELDPDAPLEYRAR